MASAAILCEWSRQSVLNIRCPASCRDSVALQHRHPSAGRRTPVNDGSLSVQSDAITESSWLGGEAVFVLSCRQLR
jgi:hypothetical protein